MKMKNKPLNKVTIFTVFLLIVGIAFTAHVMGLNDTTQSTIPADDYTGGLLDFYVCTRGNVESACDALYDNAQDDDYTGGLLDFYACTRGNVQSACDALYDTPSNS
jgi:hypothetical protein